jgi:hypothetical protein
MNCFEKSNLGFVAVVVLSLLILEVLSRCARPLDSRYGQWSHWERPRSVAAGLVGLSNGPERDFNMSDTLQSDTCIVRFFKGLSALAVQWSMFGDFVRGIILAFFTRSIL